MDVVTKSVDAAVNTVESEHENGEFEVVLSTETMDRDKENLWIDEWKTPLPARIHIDGDHGRSLEKTVGSAVPRVEDGKLIGKGTFAGTPYAQMVRQLVKEGHIDSVSVTYAESKSQKGDGVQRELLNAAFVAIPANPEAVVLASKAAKLDKRDLEREEAARKAMAASWKNKADGGLSASGDNPKITDMVQAIHDAACHLGAQCLNEIDADPGTADGANKSAEMFDRKGNIIEKSSSPEDAGSPQESTEESTATTADKAADAADESADDAALAKAKQLEIGRGLVAYLKSKNTPKD